MKTNKRALSLLLAMLLSAGVMTACSGRTTQNDTSASQETSLTSSLSATVDSSASLPADEGKTDSDKYQEKEVVLAAPRDLTPGEKDGYYCSLILQVWEPLVRLGEDGSPVPCLAESWEMSKDGKEWLINLKKGVVFHDGEAFNAEAVVANIERIIKHGPKKSPFYTVDAAKTYPALLSVEALNNEQVKLSFDVPSPTAIHRLTNFGSQMVSPKCLNDEGDFSKIVQGTGPFRIVEHKPDQYTLLEAFDDYYAEKAKVKRVRVLSMPNAETRAAALRSGEIVAVLDIGAILAAQAHEMSKDPKFVVSSKRSTITHFLQVNQSRPYLDNPKLVKAMSLAIDRKLIVKEFYYGFATASANPLNASEEGYVQDAAAYDPDQAKILAKEVLGDERISLELFVPQYGVDRYPYKEQAEYIQAAFSEIGIDVRISIIEGSALTKLRQENDYDMCMHTQGMPDGDPVTMLSVFMGPKNLAKFKNEEALTLLKEASEELDSTRRIQLYKKLQELALEVVPTIALYHDDYLVLHHKDLKAYDATSYGVTLSDMYWAGE